MATTTTTTNTHQQDSFCHFCGGYEGRKSRCAACKEVSYHNKEHQKADWKKHKACCKAVTENPVSVWIEVQQGEGNGLTNVMINHIFANKAEGLEFARSSLAGSTNPPLRSPFCELTGWDVEIYCGKAYNITVRPGQVHGGGGGGMNSAGVYLGCDLNDGMTRYNNISGTIFVTGRRLSDGKPLNKDILWGLLNFIWDAMDLFDGTLNLPREPTLQKWAKRYKEGSWVPRGGDGGIDVYSNDFSQRARDHR